MNGTEMVTDLADLAVDLEEAIEALDKKMRKIFGSGGHEFENEMASLKEIHDKIFELARPELEARETAKSEEEAKIREEVQAELEAEKQAKEKAEADAKEKAEADAKEKEEAEAKRKEEEAERSRELEESKKAAEEAKLKAAEEVKQKALAEADRIEKEAIKRKIRLELEAKEELGVK